MAASGTGELGLPPLPDALAAASPTHRRVAFLLLEPAASGRGVLASVRALPGVEVRDRPTAGFRAGLGPLVANYVLGRRTGNGLSALAGPGEFVAALRELGDAVLRPAGPLLVEWAPPDAGWAQVLAALYPDAPRVAAVRSPRQRVARALAPTVTLLRQRDVRGRAGSSRLAAALRPPPEDRVGR